MPPPPDGPAPLSPAAAATAIDRDSAASDGGAIAALLYGPDNRKLSWVWLWVRAVGGRGGGASPATNARLTATASRIARTHTMARRGDRVKMTMRVVPQLTRQP